MIQAVSGRREDSRDVSRKNIEGGGVLGQTRPNHTLLNLVEVTVLVLLAVSRAELQDYYPGSRGPFSKYLI